MMTTDSRRLEEIIAATKVVIKSPLSQDEYHIVEGTPFSMQRGFPRQLKSPRLRSPVPKEKEKAERRYKSVEKKRLLSDDEIDALKEQVKTILTN